MSIVDDLKELFQTNAHRLDERLGTIEAHLDSVRKSSDETARQQDYEIQNVRVTDVKEALKEVLTVPQGSVYELTHWAWKCDSESVKPFVIVNGVVVDAALAKLQLGASNPNELCFLEGETINVENWEGNSSTTYFLQFRVYKRAPKRLARTGEGG